MNSSRDCVCKWATSPQPTKLRPSGVHNKRLMAALPRSQLRWRLQVLACGQAVEHIHHTAVCHQGDLVAQVRRPSNLRCVEGGCAACAAIHHRRPAQTPDRACARASLVRAAQHLFLGLCGLQSCQSCAHANRCQLTLRTRCWWPAIKARCKSLL